MKKCVLLIFAGLFGQLSAQINSGKGIFPEDSCFLETPCPLVSLEDFNRGIWEIAQPAKTSFDSAYSPVNALITDASNPYPINNSSYFEIKLPNYNSLSAVLSFWHKMETDSAKDGGYIEVSHDKGQTWKNVSEEFIFPEFVGFFRENLYEESDTLYNGTPGFSGTIGWEEVQIQWIYVLPARKLLEPDTTLLRFHFISDSVDTQKSGWMIDDIRTYSVDFPGAVSPGIDKVAIEVSPHPIGDQSVISFENFKGEPFSFELMNVHGQIVYRKNDIRSSEFTLSKGSLSAGMYVMRLSHRKETLATQKILIEK